jgi:hypothetical protein
MHKGPLPLLLSPYGWERRWVCLSYAVAGADAATAAAAAGAARLTCQVEALQASELPQCMHALVP